MNKQIKKNVNHLRRLVGHKIIRTKQTATGGDFSYTDTPLILKGFTNKGEMIIQYAEGTFERNIFGSKEKNLPLDFTDRNWKLYSRVRKVADSELNKWKGKKIIRTTPTKNIGDNSYMGAPVKLISASRYHVILEVTDTRDKTYQSLLNVEFANPKEWKLAE